MAQRIRVFVSSPGDVAEERRQCGEVIQELNLTMRALIPEREVELALVRWETDTFPDLGGSPQAVVDDQINPADCDIFLGIMWSRFGTPTATAGSGTEHEFRAAWDGRQKVGRPSHLLFYFCSAPIAPQMTSESLEQLSAVIKFGNELRQLGLVSSYEDRSRFGDQVRRHLIQVLSELLHAEVPPAQAAAEAADRVSPADLTVVREQVGREGAEYERLRATMLPGDARSRRMEVVASRMRAMAQSAYPLLPELLTSERPGQRLAAVCVLQAIPTAAHLDWLAERIDAEKPFVGYHAALALLSAARILASDELDQVAAALDRAEAATRSMRRDADRSMTLAHARTELSNRRSRG